MNQISDPQRFNRNVFPDPSLLVEGEKQLGRYELSIARYSNARWGPTIPPLDVVATNRRLFLRPQGRKKLEPASIPGNYIKAVMQLELGNQHGMMIALKTGHQIYILIGKRHGEQLLDDITTMKRPRPRVHFDEKIMETDIQRIIDFIGGL